MKKLCPLTFNIPSFDATASRACEEQNCAWWNMDFSECIMMRIGRELVNIETQLNHMKSMGR